MPDIQTLARRYATWMERATYTHRLVHELRLTCRDMQPNLDGTITITVSAAVWQALQSDQLQELPSIELVD